MKWRSHHLKWADLDLRQRVTYLGHVGRIMQSCWKRHLTQWRIISKAAYSFAPFLKSLKSCLKTFLEDKNLTSWKQLLFQWYRRGRHLYLSLFQLVQKSALRSDERQTKRLHLFLSYSKRIWKCGIFSGLNSTLVPIYTHITNNEE